MTLDVRITQVNPMMVVRIFQTNPVAKVRRTCLTRIFPLDGKNVLQAKRRRSTKKQMKANQAEKGKRHPENIYFL